MAISLVAANGQVAQLVEQRTENPCVGGSIPPLATNSCSWYKRLGIPRATASYQDLPEIPAYSFPNLPKETQVRRLGEEGAAFFTSSSGTSRYKPVAIRGRRTRIARHSTPPAGLLRKLDKASRFAA